MLLAILSDRPLSGTALNGLRCILVVGILTHRLAVILGESDDGLVKTLGIERLTPAIDAIVQRNGYMEWWCDGKIYYWETW
ncbi:hypothetical protein HanIR_Chr04g0190451 [Helianthus annuus]|nr:hypothetical protein HanIR_Chr04g0190451 [Helianthus annuus]